MTVQRRPLPMSSWRRRPAARHPSAPPPRIEAFPGARRVPGLRREELAVLAGLSPDYYSRLEQGRQANISDEVLDALARALRLDEVEHTHLRDLAAPTSQHRAATPHPPTPRSRSAAAHADARPRPGAAARSSW
ncbi:helix-turn-helix domain-containing protein [Streptomyces sp. 900116325]